MFTREALDGNALHHGAERPGPPPIPMNAAFAEDFARRRPERLDAA